MVGDDLGGEPAAAPQRARDVAKAWGMDARKQRVGVLEAELWRMHAAVRKWQLAKRTRLRHNGRLAPNWAQLQLQKHTAPSDSMPSQPSRSHVVPTA